MYFMHLTLIYVREQRFWQNRIKNSRRTDEQADRGEGRKDGQTDSGCRIKRLCHAHSPTHLVEHAGAGAAVGNAMQDGNSRF